MKTGLGALLSVCLIFGVYLRFNNLDYWAISHDESYTLIQTAGWKPTVLKEKLSQSGIISAAEVTLYTIPGSNSSATDIINSLAAEEPQHPPFFYVLMGFWRKALGPGLALSRALTALLGVICIAAIFFLSRELFNSRLYAVVSTLLFSLSGLQYYFSLEMRSYVLWILFSLLSTGLLIKANSNPQRKKYWLFYGVTMLCSYYTFPMTVQVHAAHALFLLFKERGFRLSHWKFAITSTVCIVCYLPWILILKSNWQNTAGAVFWQVQRVDLQQRIARWERFITEVFLYCSSDYCGVRSMPYEWTIHIVFLGIIAAIAALFFDKTKRRAFYMIISVFACSFLVLAGADMIMGGKRSLTFRYLVPSIIAVHLVGAYGLGKLIEMRPFAGFAILLSVLLIQAGSLLELSQKPNYFGKWLVKEVNTLKETVQTAKIPLVISTFENNNFGALISLSQSVESRVNFRFLQSSLQLRPPEIHSYKDRFTHIILIGLDAGVRNYIQRATGWQLNPLPTLPTLDAYILTKVLPIPQI